METANKENSFSERQSALQDRRLDKWQTKLLPFLIVTPVTLVGVFIFLATVQMRKFEGYVHNRNKASAVSTLLPPDKVRGTPGVDYLAYTELYTLAKMEEYAIDIRYNQAGASMISGIFTKYLGFFTGMILAIVGAVFIISKLREDSSNFQGNVQEQIRFKVISSSPGIIFGVLGTLLMTVTILKNVELDVKDAPLYLNYLNLRPHDFRVDANSLNSLQNSGTISDSLANAVKP